MSAVRGSLLWIAVLAPIVLASTARAESPAPIQREVPLAATAGQLELLRTVVAPPAAQAAVSDMAGVLVVGLKPKVLSARQKADGVKLENGPHLWVYRLNEQGEAAAAAAQVTLPSPPSLSGRQTYPLALAVHPKLPLLYLWQDVQPPAEGAVPDDPKTDGFRHLLVYDLSADPPHLLQSLAEGELFARGQLGGALAFDRRATRLFVPNMQRKVPTGFVPAIGYLRLLEDGMVVPDEEETALTAEASRFPTADRTAAISAAARKAYLEQVRTGKVLDRTVRYATAATSTFGGFPCGLGFHNVSDEVTLVCGALGPVTWDEANRRAQFNTMVFYPVVGVGYRYRMTSHPTQQVLYFTGLGSNFVYRTEHIDGFLTMLPQRGTLSGVSAIASPPVVLGPRKVFACGSPEKLHLVHIDEQGLLTGARTDVPLPGSTGEALAYSPRFDKLYATVPEVKP